MLIHFHGGLIDNLMTDVDDSQLDPHIYVAWTGTTIELIWFPGPEDQLSGKYPSITKYQRRGDSGDYDSIGSI